MELGAPGGSEPGSRHPYVVVQHNVFNQSRINTVVVVTQLFTVDKGQLDEYIGRLADRRVQQILDGIAPALKPRDVKSQRAILG